MSDRNPDGVDDDHRPDDDGGDAVDDDHRPDDGGDAVDGATDAGDETVEDAGDGVACAHCGSTDTEPISLFGTGEMTMQYECRACNSVFERVKWA